MGEMERYKWCECIKGDLTLPWVREALLRNIELRSVKWFDKEGREEFSILRSLPFEGLKQANVAGTELVGEHIMKPVEGIARGQTTQALEGRVRISVFQEPRGKPLRRY